MLGERCHDVEDIRFLGVEHALDCGCDVRLVDDTLAGNTEALAHLDVVGIDSLEVFRISEEGIASVAAMESVFPLNDHAKVLVIEDDHLYGDLFDVSGGQLLDIHQERAVAVDIDDLLVRVRDFCPHRGRIAETHRAESR